MLNKLNQTIREFNKVKKNKKAQIGGTLSWFVATLIIIFVLLIGIYAASVLGKTKFLEFDKELDDSGDSWIEIKNSKAFEKNSENKGIITDWLNNKTITEDS